jgi:hypothetical protein
VVTLQTEKYLSICYKKEWVDPRGSDYMSKCTRICITIDIIRGKRVYLDEIIGDYPLQAYLENYNYGTEFSPPITASEAQKIVTYSSMSEKEYLDKQILQRPTYKPLYEWLLGKPSFYLTGPEIIIARDEYEQNDVPIKLEYY